MPIAADRKRRILRQESVMSNAPQNNGKPMDSTGADAIRENVAKVAGAEDNARATLDKLKARGDEMAKKHGG
jgi:hypothetical protein